MDFLGNDVSIPAGHDPPEHDNVSSISERILRQANLPRRFPAREPIG